MKNLLTILFAVALGLNLSAQTPYNPDSDSLITYNDVLSFLLLFGQSFTPEQLLIDGESITDLIEIL